MSPSIPAAAPVRPHEPLSESWVRPPNDVEFAKFRILIEREIGISLGEVKRPLLLSRLARRLRRLGLTTFSDYFEVVTSGRDAEERTAMFDAICTNETAFFREPRHFEVLCTDFIPRWQVAATAGIRPKSIRIWSAACSTGEEPYSLAMVLLDHFGSEWDLRVDATDVSSRAVEQARRGVWPIRKATPIPENYLRRFMLRGTRDQAGTFKAGADVRAIIRFGRLNLIDDAYPLGVYDAVFCRNVLIYFNSAVRAAVIGRLLNHVDASGYFFVGHAETLASFNGGIRAIVPNVYAR